MFVIIKKFFFLSTLTFILVFPDRAYACFLEDSFQNLKRIVGEIYDIHFPEKSIVVETQTPTKISIKSTRNGTTQGLLGPGYSNSFNAYFTGEQFSNSTLEVLYSNREGTPISGRWALFLDLQEMIRKLEEIHPSVNTGTTIAKYIPRKIVRSQVSNAYLYPKIIQYLDILGTDSAEILSTNAFFEELTKPMSAQEATDLGLSSRGHNGTQTLGLIDLINLEIGTQTPIFDIEKIIINKSDELSGETVDMEFFLRENHT